MIESRKAEITLQCWEGEYTFRLGIGDVRKLEERFDIGPMWLLWRLAPYDLVKNPQGYNWRADYYRDIILLSMRRTKLYSEDEIKRVFALYIDDCPAADNVLIAYQILGQWIAPVAAEPVGKAEEPKPAEATDGSTKEESPLPQSMEPGPISSDGLQPRSTT